MNQKQILTQAASPNPQHSNELNLQSSKLADAGFDVTKPFPVKNILGLPPRREGGVLLISMPFAPLHLPSFGLSLMKAALTERNIPAEVKYFTWDYSRIIGVPEYARISSASPYNFALLGDWIFSSALFGHSEAHKKEYIQKVIRPEIDELSDRRLIELAERAYDAAPQYIENCFNALKLSSCAIVGFTSMFRQNVASLALAKRIKEAYPELRIVFGGANLEGVMGFEILKQFTFVDWVVNGDGDLNFPEAVDRHLRGMEPAGIPGLFIRKQSSGTIEPPKFDRSWSQPVAQLDSVAIPDFTDFEIQHAPYLAQLKNFDRVLMFETSRGCWWGQVRHCTFCGLNGSTMTFRRKSFERIHKELTYLVSQHQAKSVLVVDNIMDMKYFSEFFPRLSAELSDLHFTFEVKANLKREQVAMMARCGVDTIQPGIESLSSSVLKIMDKGVTGAQNVQLLKWCREFGIHVEWNILAGFSGESVADYAMMLSVLPLISHLCPPDCVGRARVDRFSPMFDKPAEHGVNNVRPLPAYEHIYQVPVDAIYNLAYHFISADSSSGVMLQMLNNLKDSVSRWKSAYPNAALRIEGNEGEFVIIDTRPVAKQLRTSLTKLEEGIVRFCDSIRKEDDIYTHFGVIHGREVVSGALTRMREFGFLLDIDDVVLSLVVLKSDLTPLRKVDWCGERLADEMANQGSL